MATTTMHFGPEWMRAKPQTPARHQPPPSPPPLPVSSATQQQLGASSYSALVTPANQEIDKRDESRPFRYTKDDMFRIYKEGGGRGGLNLEVERWEGIVRDVGSEPAGLREMTETEKKLFAGPLNSELRRRQSTDLTNTLSSPSDRQRLSHPNSASNNSARYGPFLARRRDSTDQAPLPLPRKLSVSNTQGGTLTLPRDALPSPRNRIGPFGSGFDGVLNSGDSWSRKRPSTGVAGMGGLSMRGEGKEEDARHSEIKEEEESAGQHSTSAHDNDAPPIVDQSSPVLDASPSDIPSNDQVYSSDLNSVRQSMTGLSLDVQNQPLTNPRISTTTNHLSLVPPPGLIDPASIEWSYLDPQGQVQGPFRADVMQKWFEEGYFTPELLMKRTHIDLDWISVAALEVRAAGGEIFLSQIADGPPGLGPHIEPPKSHSPAHGQNMFNGYQPVPTRTLRTTLDSYLNGSSPTESPSSSLSGGGFGNGSPDPSAFGGRAGNVHSGDPTFGGRTFGGRTFQDSASDGRTLSNNSMARVPTIDTFNSYGGGSSNSPWSAGPGPLNQSFNDNEQPLYSNGYNSIGSGMIGNPLTVNNVHSINQERLGDTYGGMGGLSSHHDSSIVRHSSEVNGISLSGNSLNGLGPQLGAPTPFSQSPTVPFATQQHRQAASPFGDLLPEAPDIAQMPSSAVQPNNTLSWTSRRPFEPPAAPLPVVLPSRPQAAEWTPPQLAQPADPSPWLMASLPVMDDVWREMPGPNSLTFSNLGQHNKLHEEEGANEPVIPFMEDIVPLPPNTQSAQTEPTNAVATSVTAIPTPSVVAASPSVPTPGVQGSPASKIRRKSTTRDAQAPAPKTVPVPTTTTVVKERPPTTVLPVAQPKPVWAVEDDSKKQKGIAVTISLREIQEAEAREAEARKAAEKERERIARAGAPASGNPVAEDSQLFTSSWGLPTSQVGTRNHIPPGETSVNGSVSTTPAAPVWTNTTCASASKKTMKEIQEEEEKKKKLTVKESTVPAATRRAYAETTVKAVPSAQPMGGSWTTVGANGKANPPSTNAPRSVTNAPHNNPTTTTTSRTNGTTTRQTAATTAKPATPRAEGFPMVPSQEFLKWLGESLKGLNSSVNLEEITSMLLSFPLDPDQSTIEIISDLIYANSTTLDGRRFASEYVSKRKADAAARRGTAGVSGLGGKPVSIADVVKTQPKPVQEWGFKVVNKKKKGGRS